MTPDSIIEFDLAKLPDDFFADPYPYYEALRTQAPIHPLPNGYLLSRYHDVRSVYRDTTTFSSAKQAQFGPAFGIDSPLYEHHTTSLVFNDPPLHTQVRRAIGNALSQQIIVSLNDPLIRLVDDLLDELPGKADLIADFAAAIPIEIIGNLLRVPREDRAQLRGWSLAILGALEVDLAPADKSAGETAVTEFVDFLDGHIETHRRAMKKTDDDILSRLLRWEENGTRLEGRELYHQCIFLLNAGHETTTNLIGNCIELLLRYPEARTTLEADPACIDTLVEETLRFESPNQLGNRTVTKATTIGDIQLEPGQIVTLCIGAANRDSAVFEDAARFDPTRAANPHLAFGAGIHTCAGLHVARLEAKTAITELFKRFPNLGLADNPERARRARFRGFTNLPVTLT